MVKKVQRTDWKKEHRLAVADRNHFRDKCEGLQEQLEKEQKVSDERLYAVDRLGREQREVGGQLDAMQTIVELMTSAPDHSLAHEGVDGYGRDVLLGMLLEKLRHIERPIPF